MIVTNDREAAAEIVLAEFDRSILVARIKHLETVCDYAEAVWDDLATICEQNGDDSWGRRFRNEIAAIREMREN